MVVGLQDYGTESSSVGWEGSKMDGRDNGHSRVTQNCYMGIRQGGISEIRQPPPFTAGTHEQRRGGVIGYSDDNRPHYIYL